MHKHTDRVPVTHIVLVCSSDALPTGCNWLHEADGHCSPACYQTDGQTGKNISVTLRNTADRRHRKSTYTQKQT